VIVTPADATPVDYLLIGHMTADLTPNGRTVGGTVSYAIRTAHAFGLKVGLVTSAKQDEPLLYELSPYGQIFSIPASATTTFENLYSASGRTQYIRGVAAPITAAQIPLAWRNAPLVHFGPIAGEADDPAILDLFPDAKILVTLQGWLRKWDADGRVRFKPWNRPETLQRLDIMVFSEEDILESPGLIDDLAPLTRNVFYTQAERGGIHFQYGVPSPYDTPLHEVVNPTGAGDVFATSLLCALHITGSIVKATRVAAVLAAESVTRFAIEGTPTPEEVRAALAAV
jgi:sugar/nucleoside kinase (ribokinase family)